MPTLQETRPLCGGVFMTEVKLQSRFFVRDRVPELEEGEHREIYGVDVLKPLALPPFGCPLPLPFWNIAMRWWANDAASWLCTLFLALATNFTQ